MSLWAEHAYFKIVERRDHYSVQVGVKENHWRTCETRVTIQVNIDVIFHLSILPWQICVESWNYKSSLPIQIASIWGKGSSRVHHKRGKLWHCLILSIEFPSEPKKIFIHICVVGSIWKFLIKYNPVFILVNLSQIVRSYIVKFTLKEAMKDVVWSPSMAW
jgi:hypothetical protein